MERLAYTFARLANPWDLRGELAPAIRRLTDAITEHPDMIEGTGDFDTRLIQ
ncbi:asparaginase [Gorillibacterium sp. sgz500922]|uniref:asparaginase n=1 Tax=Gorillibacterium sp. sgz500922 TaxID=3446694 RepID=UPI003F67D5D0